MTSREKETLFLQNKDCSTERLREDGERVYSEFRSIGGKNVSTGKGRTGKAGGKGRKGDERE
jgi:hypothetical protein